MKSRTHAVKFLAVSAAILLSAPYARAETIPALSAYVLADGANPDNIGVSVNEFVPQGSTLASCGSSGECVNVPSLPIAQTGAFTSQVGRTDPRIGSAIAAR